MKSTEVLILGAGPAGLSLSLFLRDLGVESFVIEKAAHAGGLAKSFKIGGYTFDHSGHLLHTNNPEVLSLVQRRLGVRLDKIERKSVCRVDGQFVPYPFQQNLFYLSREKTRAALVGFFKRDLRPPGNFREWIHTSSGDGIGRQFLYPYNAKLWNVDLKKMDVDWVPRFLPDTGPREILKSAFSREKDPWGYNAIFYYPTYGGIGTIGDRLAGKVLGQTRLNARIERIDLRRKRVNLQSGEIWSYDKLVSTIPLPEFLRLSGYPPSPRLLSTGVSVFNVGIRDVFPHDFHWCYVPDPAIPFYRFGVYSNISRRAAPPGHSALYIECAAPPRRLSKFRFSAVRSHLARLGLIRNSKRVEVVHRLDLRYAYPIPLIGLAKFRAGLQARLRRRGVELLGRFGAWRYVAISDVMVEAKNLAGRLAGELR